MKAMLIWSDGTEINQSIYEDKDGVSGVDRAVAQMHKEYAEHGDNPDDAYGSFEGERSCSYCNDGEDMCQWQVVELPEEKTVTYLPIQNYPDACELLGGMVDVVEDFLEDKGITAEMLPNTDREEDLLSDIKQAKGNSESLFDYKIINENGRLGVEVFLKSKIINVSGFPFKAFVDDNVNQIVSAHVRMKN